ncbi:MAG: T9SS type A sorting domain-containing protein [Chitinophagales bacterium]|nr:T9SS type A sorting domain-containing protein [Chitinophagales bacterium]
MKKKNLLLRYAYQFNSTTALIRQTMAILGVLVLSLGNLPLMGMRLDNTINNRNTWPLQNFDDTQTFTPRTQFALTLCDDDIIVNSTEDNLISGDGNCTLREAISNANAGTDLTEGDCDCGNTIRFDVSTNGIPFTIAIDGIDENDNATGDFDINTEISIIGNGTENTIIDGAQLDRVFEIHTTQIDVVFAIYANDATSIENLTIRNGNAPGVGGGIYCESADLTLNNCMIEENSAINGGGIFSYSGNLNLTNSIVRANETLHSAIIIYDPPIGFYEYGGGICSYSGDLTLDNCTIEENTAFQGGGIAFFSGNLNLTKSEIINNTSSSDGGGILFYSGNLMTLNDCSVAYNSAGGNGLGGGIHLYDSYMITLNDCMVISNSAFEGGGIFLLRGNHLIGTNCMIEGNSATNGGGICSSDQNFTTLNDCSVAYNSANSIGGGIYSLDGSSTTLNDCSVINNSAFQGGGVLSHISNLTITNSTMRGNSASQGGGVFSSSGDLTSTNSTIAYNIAVSGGGVYIQSQNNEDGLNMINTIIANNSADNDNGQDLFLGANATINTNTRNIVEDCVGTNCPDFFSSEDPNLGPLTVCNSLYYYPLGCNSPAIDAGDPNANGVPDTDICGTPHGDATNIGSSEELIIDTDAPIANCKAASITLGANGEASISIDDINNGSEDACGIANMSLDQTAFDCSHTSLINIVALTVTDNNGNESSCTATVTVIDNVNPVAHCKNTTVQIQADGTYTLMESDVFDAINSYDNCEISNVNFTAATFTCDDIDLSFPITVTLTDPSGNSNQCTANVLVELDDALPNGWQSNDIGAVTVGNYYSFDPCVAPNSEGGSFTIGGSGNNTFPGTTNDAVAYAYQSLCGNDITITAKIESVTPDGYGGLMIRETGDADSKQVAIFSNQSNSLRHETRYFTGANKVVQNFVKPSPGWLRLQRQGNWVFAFYSTNGVVFQYVHAVYIPLNSCIQIGLASFTYLPNTQTEAIFSNVEITGGVMMPYIEVPELTETATTKQTPGLYPNPTSNIANLVFENGLNKDAMVTLRNQLGQVIEQRELYAGEFTTEWNVSTLTDGLYLFEIRKDGEEVQVLRLVKTK